jgi:diguanylate cyclase (GGDEF)-like protein
VTACKEKRCVAIPPGVEPVFESGTDLAEHIRAERIRFVLIQSALPIVFSPVAGAIIAVALWHAVDHTRLLVFASGLVLIALQRVLATRWFPDPPPTGRALRRWEWIYIGSILLVDLWWGFGALALIVPGALTESAIVFCFVMLMAGGHTASYSAHGPTVVLGVLALTLPITIAFALQPDTFHWALAFVALMFLAASFRSVRTLSYFFGHTYRLAHDLHLARERAEQLARTDTLSGLCNRRAFYELGAEALAAAVRDGAALGLVMIDIDHFKAINDRHGHAGGDAAIRAMGERIAALLRPGRVAGRLGGEEFALLLPGLALHESLDLAATLVAQSAAAEMGFAGRALSFTISAGVAQHQPGEDLDAFVARADAALYRGKREGRNRAVAA